MLAGMNTNEPQRGDEPQDDNQPQPRKDNMVWAPELSISDEERARYAEAGRRVDEILAKQKGRRRRRR